MIEIDLPVGIRAMDLVPPRPLRWLVSSGWAPQQQAVDLGTLAEGWRASMEVAPNLTEAERVRLWRAFFAQMRGPVNYFRLDVMNGAQMLLPCDAVVAGAGQLGAALVVQAPIHDVLLARAGDVISLGGRGHVVTADCRTDIAGAATLMMEPPITRAPADGVDVLIREPLVHFRLPDNAQGGWNIQPGGLETPASFDAVEVLL